MEKVDDAVEYVNQMPKRVEEWTRAELEALPHSVADGPFDSLVILPTRRLHDSGYRCMDFVMVRQGIPICRLSGCSNVIHIGGIAGFNCAHWVEKYEGCPRLVEPVDWSIDCLKGSGLLQIFTHRKRLTAPGLALSSFELFAETEREP